MRGAGRGLRRRVVVVVGMVVGTVTSIGVVGVVGVVTMRGCVCGCGLLEGHRSAVGAPGHERGARDEAEQQPGPPRVRPSVHVARRSRFELLTSCSDRGPRLTGRTPKFATRSARSTSSSGTSRRAGGVVRPRRAPLRRRPRPPPNGWHDPPELPPVVEVVAQLDGEDGQQPAGEDVDHVVLAAEHQREGHDQGVEGQQHLGPQPPRRA